MESISKKIVDLEKKNIILKTDGLKLSYEAPKDKINKEILDFLKENKSDIIKHLLNDTTEKWNSRDDGSRLDKYMAFGKGI